MKRLLCLLALPALIVACNQVQPGDRHPTMNRWMVDTYTDDMAVNAVIAGRTIYPHHFVEGTASLNARGERSLNILAKHFKDHAGTLNVRQAETDDGLYQKRLQAVRDALVSRGVDVDNVTLADGSAGGDGITSEQWRKPAENVKTSEESSTQE